MKKIILLLPVLITFICSESFACGGGLMAYTPSEGNSGSSDKKASFYMINKGVATTMFDVKSLQPVFRDISSSGNERNDKNLSEAVLKRRAEKELEAKSDTTAECVDSTHMKHHAHDNENVSPVLNLHKLH